MCGITGFCDFNKRLTRENLHLANETLHHRGPDSGDTVILDAGTANIGFGHRRLSIMDTSANGNQPMYSDDKSVVVVLNGEIYNFKEIRKELISLGYKFHSDSDTEVLIKAYQQFGIDSVNKFIGMFAYAIYDSSLFEKRAADHDVMINANLLCQGQRNDSGSSGDGVLCSRGEADRHRGRPLSRAGVSRHHRQAHAGRVGPAVSLRQQQDQEARRGLLGPLSSHAESVRQQNRWTETVRQPVRLCHLSAICRHVQ